MGMTGRQRAWMIVLAWVTIMYSTLSIAPVMTKVLRGKGILSLTVYVVAGIFFALFLYILFFVCKERRRKVYGLMGVISVITLLFMSTMRAPEERIHLIEYALLAMGVYNALLIDIHGYKCCLLTLVIVVPLGLVEEGIQGVLPGRVCDLRDFLFNALGGVIGLCMAGFMLKRKDKIPIQ